MTNKLDLNALKMDALLLALLTVLTIIVVIVQRQMDPASQMYAFAGVTAWIMKLGLVGYFLFALVARVLWPLLNFDFTEPKPEDETEKIVTVAEMQFRRDVLNPLAEAITDLGERHIKATMIVNRLPQIVQRVTRMTSDLGTHLDYIESEVQGCEAVVNTLVNMSASGDHTEVLDVLHLVSDPNLRARLRLHIDSQDYWDNTARLVKSYLSNMRYRHRKVVGLLTAMTDEVLRLQESVSDAQERLTVGQAQLLAAQINHGLLDIRDRMTIGSPEKIALLRQADVPVYRGLETGEEPAGLIE